MAETISGTKSTVFILGGSGNTGVFVVDGLLELDQFRIIVLTRPGSEHKPRITALKEKGVEIRLGDVTKLTIPELEELLQGVDIVLSIANISILQEQKKVFQAAKNAGVGRVVPSDRATPCPPERKHHLVDQKLGIRSYVKELGIGYTFIDVGWWMEVILPYPLADQGPLADASRAFIGTGDVKTAVTCRTDIGRFIAHILADPRTLNTYVFCHGEEVTLKEVYRIAEEVSGENFDAVQYHLSAKELVEGIDQEKEKCKNDILEMNSNLKLIMYQFYNSLFVQSDNTVESAKRLGALDAWELYPNFKPTKLREYAVEFYKKRPELVYDF